MSDIGFLSDLHLEASGLDLVLGKSSLLAVVGDVHAPHGPLKGPRAEHEGVWWLRDRVPDPDFPVLFVPGNHDYEGSNPTEALAAMRRAAEGSNVQVLWNDAVTLQGVRFIGTPFWSDPTQGHEDAEAVLEAVMLGTDLNRSYDDRGKPLTGHWLLEQHRAARAFVAAELSANPGLPKVVLTHWAPSLRSQKPEYANKIISGYWASNNEDLVAQADLWLHGHIHDSVDYRVGNDPGKGRVLSNPRGFSRTFGLPQNLDFIQPKIVSVRPGSVLLH